MGAARVEGWIVRAGTGPSLQLEGKSVTSEERTFTNFVELDLDWPISSF